MNRETYKQNGRDAYARGRVILPGNVSPRFWQRRAFLEGYTEARDAWCKANPGADEWDAARQRNAAWCKAMIKPAPQ